MYQAFGISQGLVELAERVEQQLMPLHVKIDEISSYNQLKVLSVMQEARLSEVHFQWSTGYGYNDIGRDKVEEIYAALFKAEDALVRPQIVSGTHALSLGLSGILRPGDTMISIAGKPYDTLEEVIGLNGPNGSSLMELGIAYEQVDLLPNGVFDTDKILAQVASKKPKMVYIQRSSGYSFRKSLTIEAIAAITKEVKKLSPDTILMVDNCYGEFIEKKEPIEVGVDLAAGSLIKNPGGGLALTGGYLVGRKDLIELISFRLTSPGIGKEVGLTFGQTRTMLQGLFMAPTVVAAALKGAIFAAKISQELGYEVAPLPEDPRSDIIQAIKLGSEEAVIKFCQGVQAAAPVDSFVKPEPWAMPGYHSPVIMAAGAFVGGSSIELSADAPIEPPYIVYFQGGLTYPHAKYGVLRGIQEIKNMI